MRYSQFEFADFHRLDSYHIKIAFDLQLCQTSWILDPNEQQGIAVLNVACMWDWVQHEIIFHTVLRDISKLSNVFHSYICEWYCIWYKGKGKNLYAFQKSAVHENLYRFVQKEKCTCKFCITFYVRKCHQTFRTQTHRLMDLAPELMVFSCDNGSVFCSGSSIGNGGSGSGPGRFSCGVCGRGDYGCLKATIFFFFWFLILYHYRLYIAVTMVAAVLVLNMALVAVLLIGLRY